MASVTTEKSCPESFIAEAQTTGAVRSIGLELNALCDAGIGTAIYLYSTQFPGPLTIHCSKGSLDYIYRSWEGRGRAAVHQQIYNAIKDKSKPVFIHCWNGIHATGAVAATALMQFCGIPGKDGGCVLESWNRPKLQYPRCNSRHQQFPS